MSLSINGLDTAGKYNNISGISGNIERRSLKKIAFKWPPSVILYFLLSIFPEILYQKYCCISLQNPND
jgi:hypothetical protein